MGTVVGMDFKTAEATEERKPMFVHCQVCKHEWIAVYLPADMGLVATALKKLFCPMCVKKTTILMGPYPKPTNEADALGWLNNGDTGISSLTIWASLVPQAMLAETIRTKGIPVVGRHPLDPSDFGRCYRLLNVMPGWRERLPEVAEKFHNWRPFVEAWDELTALYEEELPIGTCPKLYARLQQLRGDA